MSRNCNEFTLLFRVFVSMGMGLAAATLGAGAEAAQAGATPLSLSEAVSVKQEGGRNPTVAIDRRSGTVYLAWAQEAPGLAIKEKAAKKVDKAMQVLLARSDDGGHHFGPSVVVSTPQDHVKSYTVSPTRVAVGPRGEVYVLYEHNQPDYKPGGWKWGRSILRLAVSHDGGRRFAVPVDLPSEAIEGAPTTVGMLNLFVGPSGNLYASFLDYREEIAYFLKHQQEPPKDATPPTQLRVARSIDGGKSFEKSRPVSKPTCGCCGTQVAQGADGPLYATTRAAWKELKSSLDEVRDLFISTSRDGGVTWSKAAKIHNDRFKISGCPDVSSGLAVDARGRVHAAWYTGTESRPGVFYARSDDEGKSFSQPLALLRSDWVPYGDVKLALDSKDNAWVTFEDLRGEEDLIQIARISPEGVPMLSESWPGTAPDIAAVGDAVIVTWTTKAPEGEEAGGGIKIRIAQAGEGS